jgi:predicted ATPase/class 3 adenylate cyclase
MPELPTGTVTFLFTDIEGSTRLLSRLGERYGQVLADYSKITRACFEGAGGHEVDTQGDAFFIVFRRARDAIEAASEVQHALAGHEWPEGVGPAVRMGLHTGEPRLAATGYVGLDVHRAARICSAGHGGQVLLSQTTCDLLEGQLPADVVLRDLGEHRLKDLAPPQRLFQLVIPGLESEFPPLETLDAKPTNLPVLATPLLGRERVTKEVAALLLRDDVRVVTLTGAGGTGKTRIGLQVAAEVVDEFPGGVFFVGLAPLLDPALLLPTIAQAFGVSESGAQPLERTLADHLHDKRVLLVLDNFEQLLVGAPLVSAFLTMSPKLKVIVTSRASLRISAEREYPVPPLLLPDRERLPEPRLLSQYEAVALFVERAQAVRPDFELTRENSAAVAEICFRLDGLPLPIELAAARIRILSPQAILERLEQRLDLLTGGARDLPLRQQTLRGTIDWSYELLRPGEQKVFARLAAFVGGRSLDAVEAVCSTDRDGGGDLLDSVATLVDNSLLQRTGDIEGEPRFLMLETLHEYATERLAESDEAETVRRRHAEYFLALAEQAETELWGPSQVQWLDRLDREHDNFRAALTWASREGEVELEMRLAGALRGFWRIRGHLSEGRRWLEGALAKQGGQSASARAKALYAASVLALRQGDHSTATGLASSGLAVYQSLGDKAGAARVLHVLGSVAVGERDFGEARRVFERSGRLAREAGNKSLLATTVVDLGDVALNEGDYERAAQLFDESLELFRELEDRDGTAVALYNLGSTALHREHFDDAATLFEQSLRLFRELGYREGIAYCLEGLAASAASRENATGAARLLGAADALSEDLGTALEPAERDRHERTAAAVRKRLGEEAFAAAWEDGRALGERAVEFALEVEA